MMPTPRKSESIPCQHRTWLFFFNRAKGVWKADGRSNGTGRRGNLGSGTREEALRELYDFDQVVALERGEITREAVSRGRDYTITVSDGFDVYLDDLRRKQAARQTRKSTVKRYSAVREKFVPFCTRRRITGAALVDSSLVGDYVAYLDNDGYEYATLYLECTVVKQFIKFLIREGRLPQQALIHFPMRKPDANTVYCYREDEINAMLDEAKKSPRTESMHPVLLTLALTGLRIGELRQLRWTNVNLETGMINLVDEQFGRAASQEFQTTKGRRSRSLPIAPQLLPVLRAMSQHSDGFVFHGPKGARIKPDRLRRMLVRDIIKPLESRFPTPSGQQFGFRSGRLHSFRHFFCSFAATRREITPRMLMEWLGHQNSRMVARYFHLHDDTARNAIASLRLSEA